MLIFRLYATYMESLRPFRSFATVVCQMMGEDLYDLSPEVLLVVSGIFQRQFVVGTRVQTTSRPGWDLVESMVSPWLPRTWGESWTFDQTQPWKKWLMGLQRVILHGPMSHKCAMGAEHGAFRWPIFTGTWRLKHSGFRGGFQLLDFFHVFFFRKTHILHDPRTVIAPNC